MTAKILYLINSLKSAGAERVLLNIVRYVDKSKFEPIVVYFEPYHDLKPSLEKIGVKLYCLNIKSKFDPRGVFKLAWILKKERPRILHTHLPYAGIIGRTFGKLFGTCCVISTQHNVPRSFKKVTKLLDRVTLPTAHIVTCVSEGIEKALFNSVNVYDTELPKSRHLTIWNGVDFESIDLAKKSVVPKSSNTKKSVLMLGRLIKWKGQHIMLKAWPSVVEEVENAELWIVGDGPEKENLGKLADKLGVSDSVKFLGWRTDVYYLMNISNVIVAPYHYKGLFPGEGAGLVIYEGMGMGKAVISSRVPNIEKAIEHGLTGLLFSEGDFIELANLVIKTLSDPRLAESLGQNARKRAKERFSASLMSQKYETIYYRSLRRKNNVQC